MNIDEKIKELEEKQFEISKEIEELKKEKEANLIRWRAKKDIEKYFYIDDMGIITHKSDNYQNIDNYQYAIGSYYKTREQAGISKQNRLTYQQLKDIALRLNKGQEIDWENDNQKKYCISYDWDINTFKFRSCFIMQTLSTVYCLDENFLNVVLEEIGKEKLKQLLEWGI